MSYTTTATNTYSGNNTVIVTTIANMISGLPIVFTGNVFGNVTANATYYIGNITGSNQITLSSLPGGAVYALANGSGNMTATFSTGGQQIIDVVPPGDPLDVAFEKTNVNFDQIFAAGPVGSNIQIANNTIRTTNTNGNLILAPNGIGNVVSNVNIVPNTANLRNLGSPTQRWATIYTQYVDYIAGNISFSNFSVSGNISAGGYISAAGNVTGNYILGNGSQLTGISVNTNKIFNGNSYANIATANGNVVISANGAIWSFNTNGTTAFPAFTFPNIDGANGQVLVTNGNGVIAWGNGQFSVITNQTIGGTGSANTFALAQSATSDSVFVTINGISQTPETDYTVLGNAITFTTTPIVGDVAQVRFLAGNVLNVNYSNANVAAFLPTYSGLVSYLNIQGQSIIGTVTNSNIFIQPSGLGALVIQTANTPGVQIQTTVPNTRATLQLNATGNSLGDFGGGQLVGYYARPGGALLANDRMAAFMGLSANTTFTPVRIQLQADANWTSNTSTPTRVSFWTTASGSNTSAEAARLDSTGNLILYTGGMNAANGNVSANFFIGNGSQLTGIAGGTGNTGNITFNNTTITSNVANANVTVQGNGTGNVNLGSSVSVAGNITANYLYGNGYYLTGLLTTITNQTLTGDNVETNFTLDQTATANAILVTVNGISQTPDVDYIVSGNVITFTTAPYTGDTMQVRFLANNFSSGGGGNGDTGNITFSNTTISSNVANANIFLQTSGTGNVVVTGGGTSDRGLIVESTTANKYTVVSTNTTGTGFPNYGGGGIFEGTHVLGNGTPTQVNNRLAAFVGSGSENGTTRLVPPPVSITMMAAGNWSVGNTPTEISFRTATSGSNTDSIAATLQSNGNLNITRGSLSVNGNVISTGNAIASNFNTFGNVSAAGNVYANNFVGDIAAAPGNTSIQINVNGVLGAAAYFSYDYGANILYAPNAVFSGDIQSGNMTANFFIGNGSALTGIVASANTGDVTFNDINIIGDGNLHLQPDPANASAYLDIYLTAGPDIHIAGNGETVILGTDEFANVTVNVDGNVSIQANAATPHTWTFDTGGNLTFPTGNLVITPDDPAGNVASIASTDHPLVILSTGANGAAASLWIEDYANVGTSNIAAVYTNPTPGSGNVRIAVGQNGSPGPNLWDFSANGALTLPYGARIRDTAGNAVAFGRNAAATGPQGNAAVAIGQQAGDTSQGQSAVAIGMQAGLNTQGIYAVAIGTNAGNNNQGGGAVSIGYHSGEIQQGTGAIAVGSDAGANAQGDYAVAVGVDAGNSLQGTYAVAVGRDAGYESQGNYAVAVGLQAGNSLQGDYAVAVGQAAGGYQQGNNSVAIGSIAANDNQGINAVAIGNNAGRVLQGNSSVAIGHLAGNNQQQVGAVAVGLNAGAASQGSQAVAIGESAGANVQGSQAVAVGNSAGYNNQGIYAVAIGATAGESSQGNNSVAVGTGAGSSNQGINAVAIGATAGATSQGANAVAIGAASGAQGEATIAIGLSSGFGNQGNYAVAVGHTAGSNAQGLLAVAVGNSAGFTNQGQYAVAVGPSAGTTTQGAFSVAVGYSAGYDTQGNSAIAIGGFAGATSQDQNAVAIGVQAGYTSQGLQAVAIGTLAGANVQGNNSVAVGWNAGYQSQGSQAVAIGLYAGNSSQGQSAVAIGSNAGTTTQGQFSVAVGQGAGNTTQGEQAVSIGLQAGFTTQGNYAVAIGKFSANTNQGTYAVAVGPNAGMDNQLANAVAIGSTAGSNAQGINSVAVGAGAAYNTQGNSAVAVGNSAGYLLQGLNSVAVGDNAGFAFQGVNSVAIGRLAGNTSQGNNSIILNATGSVLDQTVANTFTVAPVRNDVANIGEVLFYNATSKEITYGNVISVAGNITGGNLAILGNSATITTANYSIGYLNIPQVSFAANATIGLTDSGKHYYSTSASNLLLTIANNTSVAWTVGTAITIVNRGTANITIAQGTGVSLYLAGNNTSGNRTMTTYGMSTLMNVAANVWMINGTGVV